MNRDNAALGKCSDSNGNLTTKLFRDVHPPFIVERFAMKFHELLSFFNLFNSDSMSQILLNDILEPKEYCCRIDSATRFNVRANACSAGRILIRMTKFVRVAIEDVVFEWNYRTNCFYFTLSVLSLDLPLWEI